MGELSLRRYEIRRVLGRGGQGTVYEAIDTRTHAVVALKAIESCVAENLFRFKHEFRALTDVQHHNLVHYGELTCEDGNWFFTMELVSGTSFVDHVRPSRPRVDAATPSEDGPFLPEEENVVTQTVMEVLAVGSDRRSPSQPPTISTYGNTLDEGRLRAALPQVVEALSALHDAGHVHRDVKPSNVMVSREGRVVLLDFGLVMALAGESTSDRSGTPAYMAPEQIAGGNVGPAADWYALGSMLYVALTGRPPFIGGVDSVLRDKRHLDPPPPHEVTEVPADLEALCLALLAREPAQRPDEDAIRARLGMAARRPSPPMITDLSAPFVGRELEQDALVEALHDVEAGHARAVIVEGEPGVGKSALVHRFLGQCAARVVVLAGRCYEQESVPFKGVDSIIDALSEHLLTRTGVELDLLLAGGVRFLATVFPVLCRVPAIQAVMSEERTVVSQSGLREHAFGELARMFAALGQHRQLIIDLDDLQWIDADSMALLERAVLPTSATSCLFVATLRSGVELPAAVERLRATATVIELGGLRDGEARQLWERLRGALPASTPASAAVIERELAMREAGGHPLLLAELARAAEVGRLDRRGTPLLAVLRDRVAQHDAIDRAFLEMAAVAGAPAPYEIVARAAGLDVGECLARLGRLKTAQLVRVSRMGDDRCVEPYHDRIREALCEPLRADPARLMQLELQLGRALLAGTAPDALRSRVFTIVQHLDAARPLLTRDERVRVAGLALLASGEARLATAYDQARDHARRGIELIGELGWTGAYALSRDLHMVAMQSAFLAGDHDTARALFEAARPHLTSPSDTAAMWAAMLTLETGRANFRAALDLGFGGLRELGYPMPARFTRHTVLRQFALTRRAQAGRSLAELEALPTVDDPTFKGVLQLLMAMGPVAFFVDTNLMVWVNTRIADETMRRGLCDVAPFGFGGYGIGLAGVLGRPEEGAAFGDLAVRLNERFGSMRLAAKLFVQRGAFITHWVRPYGDARNHLRTAYELSLKLGDAEYEVYAASILSVVNFCESAQLATVQEGGEWARDIAARRRAIDMSLMPDIHARHAEALRRGGEGPLDLGRPSSSDAELRALLADATRPVSMFYYHFARADLAYLAGDVALAETFLAEARKRPTGIFAIPTTVELAFLEAMVAARRCDSADPADRDALIAVAADHGKRLERWAEHCPHNYEPHALLARAELARVRGQHTDALRNYERAVGAARRGGATKREAMALHRAADHALARGNRDAAARYREAAVDAYTRWGAIGLARALAERA